LSHFDKVRRDSTGQILEAALSEVGDGYTECSLVHGILDAVGYTDRPGDAQRLQTGRDIDVFAVHVSAAGYYAPLVNPDAKLDPVRRSQGFVQPKELSLYLDHAYDGRLGGVERGEDRIAGIVVDSPTVRSYGSGEYIEILLESPVCPVFVERAESGVVGDVGIDDRGPMSRKRVIFISD
jgi:hypothetical protein